MKIVNKQSYRGFPLPFIPQNKKILSNKSYFELSNFKYLLQITIFTWISV